MKKTNIKTSNKNVSIEDSFKNLDKIIEKMDDEKCSIEEGIELYEKGTKILNELSKKIEKIDNELKELNNGQ